MNASSGANGWPTGEAPGKPRLGDRVKLSETRDIIGLVVERTEYLDGSERFGVHYWHNGERKFVTCMESEMSMIPIQSDEDE